MRGKLIPVSVIVELMEEINSMMNWFQPEMRPVSVRLHYDLSGGEHPLTPPEIRDRYKSEGKGVVLWKHQAADAFGLRDETDELVWRLDDIAGFELGFWRPAKGAGSIFMAASLRAVSEPRWLLSCSGFTPEVLHWFRQVSEVLADWFPERVVEQDYGFDA